ncbi:MAG: ribosome biogenesis GTP-binding protein YihA/YsxC [Clostridiales bacterium]|nr:ribosome biogenesis GTP-binding protein YihA/YsxC [Clostridiales bacterium]
MRVNNAAIDKTAVKKSQYPANGLPEVAFAGKSNVGKSSLINTMAGRKALARTSGSPGKTRTINFFIIENSLYFVDLPGYGYAKASKAETAKWGPMMDEYLLEREQLKAIILLVDVRHEAGKNDIMMLEYLRHYGYKIIIAATKCDKISRNRLPSYLKQLKASLSLREGEKVIPFSSVTKQGRDELWEVILEECGLEDNEKNSNR